MITNPLYDLMGLGVGVLLLALAAAGLLVVLVWLAVTRLRQHREENRPPATLLYPVQRGPRRPIPSAEVVTYNSNGASDDTAVRLSDHVKPVPVMPAPAADADSEATLQLLPGRLEPVGRDTGEDIRFVRVPGLTRFTLGRSSVAEPGHIQLKAATASRMHAYMVFENGRWRLGNMSSTNQVVVNGAALNGNQPRVLEDGDRIELGELTFVFRAR